MSEDCTSAGTFDGDFLGHLNHNFQQAGVAGGILNQDSQHGMINDVKEHWKYNKVLIPKLI